MARKQKAKPKFKALKRRKRVLGSRYTPLARVFLVVLALIVIAVSVLVTLNHKPDPVTQTAGMIGAPSTPTPELTSTDQLSPVSSVVQLAAPTQIAAVTPLPAWQKNAVELAVATRQPMIAIVIDDMGVDRSRSQLTVALQGPLTLAYLAYAGDLAAQTKAARAAGHELLVHVPMEPSNANTDPGPYALLADLTSDELVRRIDWNLDQFKGYVGINNHMGSKATSDRVTMRAVMAELRERELLFLDSRTSRETVAQEEAVKAGIPALRRDVFIDHDPSPIAVRAALLDVENVAYHQGYAIAIGHPRDATIGALSEWLPDVHSRGFAIVPVSAIAMNLQLR